MPALNVVQIVFIPMSVYLIILLIILINVFFLFFLQILGDFYHFHHNSVRRRSVSPSHYHHRKLSADDRVRWSQQQRILSRKKRDFLPLTTEQGTTKTQTSIPKESTTTTVQKTTTHESQTIETSKQTTIKDETTSKSTTILEKQTIQYSNIPPIIVDKANQGVTNDGQTTVQARETSVQDKQTTLQSSILSTASPNRADRDLVPPFGQRASKAIGPLMSDTKFPLNDHRWPQMWYLVSCVISFFILLLLRGLFLLWSKQNSKSYSRELDHFRFAPPPHLCVCFSCYAIF